MLLHEKENLIYTKYDEDSTIVDKHMNINRVSLEQLNKIKELYNENYTKKINVASIVNLSIFLLLKEISEIESDTDGLDFINELANDSNVFKVLHEINGVKV